MATVAVPGLLHQYSRARASALSAPEVATLFTNYIFQYLSLHWQINDSQITHSQICTLFNPYNLDLFSIFIYINIQKNLV